MRFILALSLSLAVCLPLAAEGTNTWVQTSYDEFARGTTKGVSIRSDGTLELAPAFKHIYTLPATFVWAAAADADGSVYLGTGAPARVYRITPDGKASVILEPKELQVQALAVRDGTIYAATSPDGKVYKITRQAVIPASQKPVSPEKNPAPPEKEKPAAEKKSEETPGPPVDPNYTAEVFFDPETKYIWSMTFAPGNSSDLYVATGDRGEIYSVNREGKGSVFFKSDEAHIRTLAFNRDGELIAGSDGSGLVYRISPAGEGFVIYSAPKKEITALAIDEAGNIYAAGVGEKRSAQTASPQSGFNPPASASTTTSAQPAPTPVINPLSSTGGSEVYMISRDGSPRRLWNAKDDIVYALTFDATGRLIAGSGNKGRIVGIERNGDFIDLVKASATQVTAFAKAPNGGLYAVTSNLGKLFQMGATPEEEGTLESEVFDAKIFSRWGRAELRGEGEYDLFARSGNVDNPDRNWSTWKKIDPARQSAIEAPPARFVQWKVTLRPAKKAHTASHVESVKLFYRPQNVAPVIEDVVAQAGARIPPSNTPRNSGSDTITLNVGSNPNPFPSTPPRVDGPITATRDRGSIAVRWAARDDNDDDLLFSLYYRGDGETQWKLLKDKIEDRFYSWDAGLLPDGGYLVKVVATDAPSHTPDEALSDSRESRRFEVDTTPPRIDGLTAKRENSQLHVSFSANDTFSNIQRAEFSIDAGEWQFVEPVGQISDSLVETYDFNLPLGEPSAESAPKPLKKRKAGDRKNPQTEEAVPDTVPLSNEHVVVVRVYDRFSNVGTAKIVVK
jgi:hypothetical protein